MDRDLVIIILLLVLVGTFLGYMINLQNDQIITLQNKVNDLQVSTNALTSLNEKVDALNSKMSALITKTDITNNRTTAIGQLLFSLSNQTR